MALYSDQQKAWLAHVGDIRGRRLSDRAAVLKFINECFSDESSGWLFAIYLDRSLRICDLACLGRGSIDGVQVRIAEVIAQGSVVGATCFILIHNRPEGDPTPNQQDIRITGRIRQLSDELDMPLLDHFIVANGQIASVANF